MSKLTFFILIIGLASLTEARLWTRCQLAVELKRQGLTNLGDWVCLAEAESGRRNEAKGGPNTDGSYDHGMFQINDRYWCSTTSTPGKDCGVTCASLRDENLTNDAACVKKIYGRHGFSAWYGWRNKCQGRDVSVYIAGCGV